MFPPWVKNSKRARVPLVRLYDRLVVARLLRSANAVVSRYGPGRTHGHRSDSWAAIPVCANDVRPRPCSDGERHVDVPEEAEGRGRER